MSGRTDGVVHHWMHIQNCLRDEHIAVGVIDRPGPARTWCIEPSGQWYEQAIPSEYCGCIYVAVYEIYRALWLSGLIVAPYIS